MSPTEHTAPNYGRPTEHTRTDGDGDMATFMATPSFMAPKRPGADPSFGLILREHSGGECRHGFTGPYEAATFMAEALTIVAAHTSGTEVHEAAVAAVALLRNATARHAEARDDDKVGRFRDRILKADEAAGVRNRVAVMEPLGWEHLTEDERRQWRRRYWAVRALMDEERGGQA